MLPTHTFLTQTRFIDADEPDRVLKGRSPADSAGLERLVNWWNARKVKSTVAKLVLVVVGAAGLDSLTKLAADL